MNDSLLIQQPSVSYIGYIVSNVNNYEQWAGGMILKKAFTTYEGYLESNLLWAVNKTSNEKKKLYAKNTYLLKLALNTVTTGTEALVLGNTFLYACNKEVCCLWAQPSFVLRNTKKIVQSKRYGMLISSVVLLHDNACLHTAAHTQALLELFNWGLLDHPLYSPDLALSDTTCLLIPTWKIGCDHSASTIMSNNEELMEGVKTWLSS
jgi:hypothetical protein